jgi:hypothetical protein
VYDNEPEGNLKRGARAVMETLKECDGEGLVKRNRNFGVAAGRGRIHHGFDAFQVQSHSDHFVVPVKTTMAIFRPVKFC